MSAKSPRHCKMHSQSLTFKPESLFLLRLLLPFLLLHLLCQNQEIFFKVITLIISGTFYCGCIWTIFIIIQNMLRDGRFKYLNFSERLLNACKKKLFGVGLIRIWVLVLHIFLMTLKSKIKTCHKRNTQREREREREREKSVFMCLAEQKIIK